MNYRKSLSIRHNINAKSYIGVINILILNIDSVRWDTERTSTDTEKV
jgi:hypothetical protein